MTIALILVSLLALIMLALGVRRLRSPLSDQQRVALQRRLAAIADNRDAKAEVNMPWQGHSGSGIFRRLSRLPIHERLAGMLMRAASPRSVEGLVKLIALAALVMGVLGGALTRSIIAGVVLAIVGGLLPLADLAIKANRRRAKFEAQLPDALDFMARALRAGHGLTMAFQIVGEELSAPVSEEFSQVFDEINFGNSFQDALSKMPERINSPDLSFFVVGILIQRETGGNLSELLRGLSATVRERTKLQGKVRTLASEGKFAGVLLGILPFALAAILTAVNPTYMGALWSTETGQKWVMGGGIMMALGFAWMWKIAQIKV